MFNPANKDRKNNQSYYKAGYSLLEVLVTLAIIGILTGIAIPKYQKYSRTAKRVEAKVSLSQIYTAQKHFFIRWRFYTHDLKVIGVAPEGELIYNAGFNNANSAKTPTHYSGATISTDNKFKSFFGLCTKDLGSGEFKACGFSNKDNPSGNFSKPPNIPAGTIGSTGKSGASIDTNGSSFRAIAIADLKNEKPKNPTQTKDKDIWSINQYRQVEHIQDGS